MKFLLSCAQCEFRLLRLDHSFLFIVALATLTLACTAKSKDLPPLTEAKSSATGEPKTLLSAVTKEVIHLDALSVYKETLLSRGQRLEDQGILIESLDGKQLLAEHNAEAAFNPASVMKLATSLVALEKYSPDYRYRTNFLADGTIDRATRKLVGDLVVEGGSDPMFSRTDAEEVATALVRLGVTRVTGSLRIAGSFTFYARGYKLNLSRQTSAAKLRETLQRAGVRIDGSTVWGETSGTLLLTHHSDTLANILLYQNSFSSNAVAEVIGESIGGAEAIQTYLEKNLALEPSTLYVGRPSGLEFNRITPRASLKILRKLLAVLENYALKPEDILPVAGVDSGTLTGRFARDDYRGAVIAKTGTLFSIDRGVSTLVGLALTKSRGPLLFAIFNSDGRIHAYRNLQDDFLQDVIAESGGATFAKRTEDALAEKPANAIVQVFYKEP